MPNLTLHHATMHHTQGEGFVISAVQSPVCQPESLPSTLVRGLYIYNRRHPPVCRALASHLQQSRCITTGPRIKFPRRTRSDVTALLVQPPWAPTNLKKHVPLHAAACLPSITPRLTPRRSHHHFIQNLESRHHTCTPPAQSYLWS